MSDAPINYRQAFLRSGQHAALALLTLGVGFVSASPLGLILGAGGYALGWIYLPDMPFFRNRTDRRAGEAQRAASLAQVAEFVRRRDGMLGALTPKRQQRYAGLADVCRGIETAGVEAGAGDPHDPRLRRLDELMWTFLRLLTIEESFDRFLETESREDLPGLIAAAEPEVNRLGAELEQLKQRNDPSGESVQRLFGSRAERLEVLRKRLTRVEQARRNLDLVVSEQDRLDQQVKLIRADAIAARNADALTARIDATVEHLGQTNKWLAELDEFKDVINDMPASEVRIGFGEGPATPPPLVRQTTPVVVPPRRRNREGV
jgi:hypothetical protein